MKNLDHIFDILNDLDINLDLATIGIYDKQNGEYASFSLGVRASEDYSGNEMEALGDRLHAARSYSEMQEILEALPDRYTVSAENISISE